MSGYTPFTGNSFKMSKTIVVAASLAVLVGVAATAFVVGQSTKNFPTSNICSADVQIREMEDFGRVGIVYITPIFDDELPSWSATLRVYGDIEMEIKERKASMCEVVDALYYKFLEFPALPRKKGK